MSKFLTTTEISYRIESLINEASTFILLISPYLKIHSRLQKIIESKIKKSSVAIIIVCRSRDLDNATKLWLKTNDKIHCCFVENLHAKCYLNENEAILTSMNLYDYSMVNNVEFGISIKKEEDGQEYEKIKKESSILLPDEKNSLLEIKLISSFKIDWSNMTKVEQA